MHKSPLKPTRSKRSALPQAIAAVAISRHFTITQTTSAGLFVSLAVLLFSVTGLLSTFTRAIPIPVVKGIQVGAGLSLITSAGTTLLQPLGWTSPSWADNRLWALASFLALLFTQTRRARPLPYALAIFISGIIFALIITAPSHLPHLQPWHPRTYIPSLADFKLGALDAGLGQLPLTTLNSVVAVSFLSSDLLPDLPAPSVTALGLSVAGMNLIGGWFGAMPVCHGSGGLAAQYRFGARSGASIILLGIFKMVLGLTFGEELIILLRSFPKAFLGVMVLAAGFELARVGESLNWGARDLWVQGEQRDLGVVGDTAGGGLGSEDIEDEDERLPLLSKRKSVQRELNEDERGERWMVMLMTVGTLLAFKNDAVGFAAGMLCHWAYKFGGETI